MNGIGTNKISTAWPISRPGFLRYKKPDEIFTSFIVKSVHLYRSRKAPFCHEFAVLCLSDKARRESWMRVERAARVKTNPKCPRA